MNSYALCKKLQYDDDDDDDDDDDTRPILTPNLRLKNYVS